MVEEAPRIQVGSYKLLHQIGAGGMGTVWLGEHTTIGRRVAIKLLHHENSFKPDMVQRFFNEARAAAAINDPGIVQILDFGSHDDGRVYIVMELLEGEPLDRRLARHGTLAVNDALRIARQVASSLGAAHARSIIHRDLKPENIFLQVDAEVPGGERTKLLDFGIAKLAGEGVTVITNESTIMGTPVFMSPEQCRGAGLVDQRSDIYSLGCVLFALITGRPPFEARGPGEIIVLHVTTPAPKASSRLPGVPPEVDKLIAKCLEKDPDDRFQTGAELAAAITTILGASTSMPPDVERVPRATPVKALPAIPSVTTTLSTATGQVARQRQRRPRNRATIGATAAAAIAVGGLITFLVVRSDSSSSSWVQPKVGNAAPTPVEKPAAAAPPAASPSAVIAPTVKSRPAADPIAETGARMGKLAGGFDAWAHEHPTLACPAIEELADGDGTIVTDAWNRPLQVTCTEQPSHQVIGILSAGPDGIPDNTDDVDSWNVAEVAPMLKGKRWQPKSKKSKVPGDIDGDGIPDIR